MDTPSRLPDAQSPSPAQPGPESRISVSVEHGVHVMRFPTAQVDGIAVRLMYETAVELIDRPNARLLVDFVDVGPISSGTMGMLITIKKKCLGVGAQMHVLLPDPMQMQQFKIMNLHIVLNLFGDMTEALRRFKPPAA